MPDTLKCSKLRVMLQKITRALKQEDLEVKKMPDYSTPNKRKRYIKSEFRRFENQLEDVIGRSKPALLYGPFGERRTRALLAFYDRAEAEFGRLSKHPVIEALVDAEIRPLRTYNDVNSNNDLTIGAALWILETMRKTERFLEMTKILPDLTGDPPLYLPMDFSHPCFSNDLIEAVMYVLMHKHVDGMGMDTELASAEAAIGEKPEQTFAELMDMLPEEKVNRACERFKELQWNLLSRYIRCDDWLTQEIDRMGQRINSTISAPFAGPLANPMMSELGSDEKMRQLAEEGEKSLRLKSSFPRRFSDFIQMERKQIIRETGSRVMADELSGFTIEDPYEICFAIYYLIESRDDAPWLMSSGSLLCDAAVRMLPWFLADGDLDEDNDDWDSLDSWDDALTYDVNGWLDDDPPEEEVDFYHTKHQGRTLAQIVYELSRGVVPVGQHPFEKNRLELIEEGMDDRVARKVIDMAEMFFLRDFQADTYKAFEPFSWEKDEEAADEEAAQAQEKTTRDVGLMPTPGGYWGRTFGIEAPEEKATEVVREAPKEAGSEELEKAKQEIKALRDALYKERREASDERAKYEHELKALRMEHRELADLRTLVFNQENERQERLERTERKINYPYSTRKRTVIFGGHDTFLKAIKPMLPTVRFVDANNLVFNPEIIRNAEVVWIQNNCISHSQYWAIVKNCKLAGIQMRYFGYASAEKCAEQVVEWDRK